MENTLFKTVEKIINLIEDNKIEIYTYNNNKLTIIDKNNNLDFQAKLGVNNYYFKDNITGKSFVKAKKYIDNDTKIQQILIEAQQEKSYYSYLERDGHINLVSAYRIEGENSLVCNNLDVVNHTCDEISQYADECFKVLDPLNEEGYNPDEDDEMEITEMEDEEIKRVFGFPSEDDYDDSEDEYDYSKNEYDYTSHAKEFFDFEFKQIEENEIFGLSNSFEQNKIEDYEKYILKKQECEANGEKYDQHFDRLPISDYTDAVEEYYSAYELKINGKEVDGEAKARIVADCEASADEKNFDSESLDIAAVNLKAVLEAIHEKDEYEKD